MSMIREALREGEKRAGFIIGNRPILFETRASSVGVTLTATWPSGSEIAVLAMYISHEELSKVKGVGRGVLLINVAEQLCHRANREWHSDDLLPR